MQGTKLTVFQFADKIEAFKRKVGMWSRKVKHGNIQMFHHVSDFLEDRAEVDITSDVSEHLDKLFTKLIHYFPEDPRRGNLWILNPFAVSCDSSEVKLSESLHEELLQYFKKYLTYENNRYLYRSVLVVFIYSFSKK